MKKLVLPLLIFGMLAMLAPIAEARSAESNSMSSETLYQQWGRGNQRSNRRYNRGNNRRPRTYTTTRIRRSGLRMYRETIRVTHLPNGRTRTQVIRRVRIR